MKQSLLSVLILLCLSGLHATNYYSHADGEWTDSHTWSANPDSYVWAGTPGTHDHVFIRHRIVHEAGTNYTHYGNVVIELTGTYDVRTGNGNSQPYFFAGDLFDIYGHLITSSDFQHQIAFTSGSGLLILHESSFVEIGDDLILNAAGQTIINNADCGTATTVDDIYFVGTQSQLCGNGRFIVPDQIRAWDDNGAETFPAHGQYLQQMCRGFSFYASEGDCDNDNPRDTGTGTFTLPVEYLSFNATQIGARVELVWETASESQNDFFTLERSYDGLAFTAIDQVDGAGNSQAINRYQRFDALPVIGQAFYRIKQTDFDGSFSYSSVIAFTFAQVENKLTVYPNPLAVGSQLQLYGLDTNQDMTVELGNLNGQILYREMIPAQSTQTPSVWLPAHFAPGIYLITISTETQLLSQKIQIQ
ncbi:MAG: T9SS type A sorting domain-containing protein [Bacteroidota bacterium]